MCCVNLPDEIVEKQLQEALEKKNFNEWNATSINNLVFVIINNSEKCKILAIQLLKEYKEYNKINL